MEIYIWGTGCGASEAIDRGLDPNKITAFIDNHPFSSSFQGIPVLTPDVLQEAAPDLLIVTSRFAEEIGQQCRKLGISEEKILYMKDHNLLADRNDRCTAALKILGAEFTNRLVPRQHLVTEPDSLYSPILDGKNDYVRISTLELLSRQIAGIPGALAELGVYKGGFACCLNQLMPERKLYLFDTFSGFEPEEGRREMEQNTCTSAFLTAHKNTAASQVLARMPYPDSIVLKQGCFPQSLCGLEERFALVSLDADFQESTLEGLRYFWPRLNEGGYLMLHDWGSPRLTGVAEAVRQYEREVGHRLPAVPIPDIGNSLIISKVSIH